MLLCGKLQYIMFIDEKTQVEILADLNCTLIHGTHRACDLIPAFLEVIENTPEYTQIMQTNDSNLQVIFDPSANERDERWESDDMCYFLNEELFDILDSYAPEGYYFGAHPGDGSDFGYWESSVLD